MSYTVEPRLTLGAARRVVAVPDPETLDAPETAGCCSGLCAIGASKGPFPVSYPSSFCC